MTKSPETEICIYCSGQGYHLREDMRKDRLKPGAMAKVPCPHCVKGERKIGETKPMRK